MAISNELFKKANLECEYTPEQIQELKRCKKDPIYFIKQYIKVQHPKLGSIPFELYDYQMRMIDGFINNRFTICKVGRQMGKCFSGSSYIYVYRKPKKWFKKIILKTLYRKEYAQLYNNKNKAARRMQY